MRLNASRRALGLVGSATGAACPAFGSVFRDLARLYATSWLKRVQDEREAHLRGTARSLVEGLGQDQDPAAALPRTALPILDHSAVEVAVAVAAVAVAAVLLLMVTRRRMASRCRS